MVEAAVTFIVAGMLAAHQHLEKTLKPALDKGIVNQSMIDTWVDMAKGSHEGNAQLQRDEAFRSASLAGIANAGNH